MSLLVLLTCADAGLGVESDFDVDTGATVSSWPILAFLPRTSRLLLLARTAAAAGSAVLLPLVGVRPLFGG